MFQAVTVEKSLPNGFFCAVEIDPAKSKLIGSTSWLQLPSLGGGVGGGSCSPKYISSLKWVGVVGDVLQKKFGVWRTSLLGPPPQIIIINNNNEHMPANPQTNSVEISEDFALRKTFLR